MSETIAKPTEQLMQIMAGQWVARCVSTAAELGIADAIGDGRLTTEELATATKTHAPSLYRLMRGLASAGVFREDGPGVWTATPLGDTLRTNRPGSLHACAVAIMGAEHYDAWKNLPHAVKTGQTAFDYTFGKDVWAFFAENPGSARHFDQAMVDFSEGINAALLKAYDFSGINHLVDVGGGHGGLITGILKKYPAIKGTLFDQPYVVAAAIKNLQKSGVENRCERVGGDFFDSVTAGADAYILKFIIHDWDDERSVKILTNVRRAVQEKGKLLLVDCVIPEGNAPDMGKLMDVNMLVMTGGRERTQAEFKDLLAESGFKLTKVTPTESPLSIIEAVSA
jgi:ubiquinone/menaquinone biosynthesis C-methylase UbiE